MRPPDKSSWAGPVWALCLLLLLSAQHVVSITGKEQRRMQAETRALWKHGYTNYMAFAYPEDELKPLSCRGQGRDHANPGNYARNDVNGDYSLTYLDLISTMPLMLGEAEFVKAIDRVLGDIKNFDRDVKVQVFEVTIRILGSLLSSYQQLVEIEKRRYLARNSRSQRTGWTPPLRKQAEEFLSSVMDGSVFARKVPEDKGSTASQQAPLDRMNARRVSKRSALEGHKPSTRANRLLALAKDLGDRLLPAFESPTGLPYARINLRRGIDDDETEETCTAATGSLTLEFTLLSQLTGNPVYERVARESFMRTWSMRIPGTGLLGNTLGVRHGRWMAPGSSGIGAGIDSFYEYALKGAILFDDDAYMGVWDDSYRSVMQHVRAPDQHLFRNVYMATGHPVGTLLDSLSAFWPGLQVLAGDVEQAIKSHLLYWHLWQKHSSMPEGFNYVNKTVEWAGYPLRPEFIESTYWLFRATKDPFYLEVGKRILKDLTKRTKVRCGFAVLHNIQTGAKEDRMESFMLSETLKYLYLLFDERNPINTGSEGTVFTTEGHILKVPRPARGQINSDEQARRRTEFAGSQITCPIPTTSTLGGLRVGIRSRADYDYARTLVDMPLLEKDYWDISGQCQLPLPGFHHFEIALTAHIENTTATPKTAADKEAAQSRWDGRISRQSGDLVISNAQGIRALLTRSADGDAFEVTSVGNHRVQAGQYVYIEDSLLATSMAQDDYAAESTFGSRLDADHHDHLAEVGVRLSADLPDRNSSDARRTVVWKGLGATAVFGRPILVELNATASLSSDLLGVSVGPLAVALPLKDRLGCSSDSYDGLEAPFVAFPQRGECTFREKMDVARKAGASGVIVWGNDDDPLLLRPSDDVSDVMPYNGNERGIAGDITMIYVPKQAGLAVVSAHYRGEVVHVELPTYFEEMLDLEAADIIDLRTRSSDSHRDKADWEQVLSALKQLLDETHVTLEEPKDEGQDFQTGQYKSKQPASGTVDETPADGRPNGSSRREFGPPHLTIAGLPIRNIMLTRPDATDRD